VAPLLNSSQSQSYITIDGQSASLSWRQAPIWDLQAIFLHLSVIILGRGIVFGFQLLLGIASAVFLGSESHRTVKVKVVLRPTVSRSVYLGVRHPFGTRGQYFFFLKLFLDPYWFD
jgi:hypothetical protein